MSTEASEHNPPKREFAGRADVQSIGKYAIEAIRVAIAKQSEFQESLATWPVVRIMKLIHGPNQIYASCCGQAD